MRLGALTENSTHHSSTERDSRVGWKSRTRRQMTDTWINQERRMREREREHGKRTLKKGSQEWGCIAFEGISGSLELWICSCLLEMEAYMSVPMRNWPDEPCWVTVWDRVAPGKLLLQCTYRTRTGLNEFVPSLHLILVFLHLNSWQGPKVKEGGRVYQSGNRS